MPGILSLFVAAWESSLYGKSVSQWLWLLCAVAATELSGSLACRATAGRGVLFQIFMSKADVSAAQANRSIIKQINPSRAQLSGSTDPGTWRYNGDCRNVNGWLPSEWAEIAEWPSSAACCNDYCDQSLILSALQTSDVVDAEQQAVTRLLGTIWVSGSLWASQETLLVCYTVTGRFKHILDLDVSHPVKYFTSISCSITEHQQRGEAGI